VSDVPAGVAIVAKGALGNMRELEGLLREQGIPAELVAPPKEQRSS
jgi:hypothetical protein